MDSFRCCPLSSHSSRRQSSTSIAYAEARECILCRRAKYKDDLLVVNGFMPITEIARANVKNVVNARQAGCGIVQAANQKIKNGFFTMADDEKPRPNKWKHEM